MTVKPPYSSEMQVPEVPNSSEISCLQELSEWALYQGTRAEAPEFGSEQHLDF